MSKKNFSLQNGMHFHLIGIGGAGISAIAHVLLGRGFMVSGSDMEENDQTIALKKSGALVYSGHKASHISGADALIISSAIPVSNVEVKAAQEAGLPIFKRADFLHYLMEDSLGIAVAGSHGKTTTTGMIAHILLETDNDPSVILGGVLTGWDVNGRAGQGPYFVIEADEYDYMFLGLKVDLAVVTNMEHDHPDIFPTPEAYEEAFHKFVQLLPPSGVLVICGDDQGSAKLHNSKPAENVKVIRYGISENEDVSFDFQALDLRPNQLGGTDFLVQRKSETLGLVRLRIPGSHNVRNALAAIAISCELDLDFSQICLALANFGGVGRRFQITGEVGGVTIIDDYAHHPTEIKATLAAARQRYPQRRLWAVWQPHTYSRTKMMLDQFTNSFEEADRVIALDIYKSRETNNLGIDSAAVVKSMNHPSAVHIAGNDEAIEYLLERIHADDVVCTLGAGDGNQVGIGLQKALQKRLQTFHP